MADRYTKGVLTMIAIALVGLLIQNAATTSAAAQFGPCGTRKSDPCFVEVTDVEGPVQVVGPLQVVGAVSIIP